MSCYYFFNLVKVISEKYNFYCLVKVMIFFCIFIEFLIIRENKDNLSVVVLIINIVIEEEKKY